MMNLRGRNSVNVVVLCWFCGGYYMFLSFFLYWRHYGF